MAKKFLSIFLFCLIACGENINFILSQDLNYKGIKIKAHLKESLFNESFALSFSSKMKTKFPFKKNFCPLNRLDFGIGFGLSFKHKGLFFSYKPGIMHHYYLIPNEENKNLFKNTLSIGFQSKVHLISAIVKINTNFIKPMETLGIIEYAFLLSTFTPIKLIFGVTSVGNLYAELDVNV